MQVLFLIGLTLWLINVLYWSLVQRTITRIDTQTDYSTSDLPSVNLIVVAHNDESNLRENVPFWRAQKYKELTITLVDDGSTDQTAAFLENVKGGNITCFHFQKTSPGKKASLAKALSKNKAEYVVLTDADCRPSSDLWIKTMLEKMVAEDAHIGLGYAPFYRVKSKWINALARFETTLTALQYFSWAAWGTPYMGVGRNLAYHHSYLQDFQERSAPKLASGDDDLFVQSPFDNKKTSLILDDKTHVYSDAPHSILAWFRQKSRHVTTAYEYNWKMRLILGLVGFSQIGWWLIFAGGLKLALLLTISRYVVLHLTGRRAFKQLNVTDLQPWRLILDILLSLAYIIILPLSLFRNKTKW